MQEDKHAAAIREAQATIRAALDSNEGLLAHQRRLMAMLSIGTAHSIEIYLHRLGVIKPGAQIKHEWFLLSDQRLRTRIGPSLTKQWTSIPLIEELCSLARKIETGRNDIVYGAPLPTDRTLREKIDNYLDLIEAIEKETGAIQ